MAAALLGVVVPSIVGAQDVTVFPGPDGIPASDDYAVEVVQAGVVYASFTYKNASDDPEDDHIESEVMAGIEANPALKSHFLGVPGPALAETEEYQGIDFGLAGQPAGDLEQTPQRRRSVSFSTFSFEGPITVRVRNLKTSMKTAKILPSSRGIEGRVEEGLLVFGLTEPAKLAIVINGNHLDPLFLFADAPEMDVPQAGEPGVLSVAAGSDPQSDLAAVRNRANRPLRSERMTRLTSFNDDPDFKCSQGVMADDGRLIALQLSRTRDQTGYGIIVMDIAAYMSAQGIHFPE